MAAKFTPERFVEIWMKSDSVKDVARKLRVSQPYTHQYATQLRKNGVKLKEMARGRRAPKIDTAALNKIVEKHSLLTETDAAPTEVSDDPNDKYSDWGGKH